MENSGNRLEISSLTRTSRHRPEYQRCPSCTASVMSADPRGPAVRWAAHEPSSRKKIYLLERAVKRILVSILYNKELQVCRRTRAAPVKGAGRIKADKVDGLRVNLGYSSKPSGRTEDWLSYNEEEIVNLALMPQFPLEAFRIHRGVKRPSA